MTDVSMIDVLVVDDQQLIRSAVGDLVSRQHDMRLVGSADNGVEAVRMAQQLRPHIVLMDVQMPFLDGIEATALITDDESMPNVHVLILTTFEDDPDYVVRGVRNGAAGFVGKGVEPDVLLDAIRTVHRGDGMLSPRATKNLIDQLAGAPDNAGTHPDLESLTAREVEILRLVARGQSNQVIAEQLSISALTVKTHVSRTMTKLGCHDRSQLVVAAFRVGLVTPDGP